MQSYAHKRGDTFSLGGTVLGLPSGTIVARAQLRQTVSDQPIQDLTLTLGAYVDATTPRDLLIEALATETVLWPIGDTSCDIEFSEPGGIVVSSETFTIKIVRDITR